MIEFTDISVVNFIGTILSPITPMPFVVWAPPQSSRQALTNAAIEAQKTNPTPPPANTSGMPGVSIWRTQVTRNPDLYSRPRAQEGWSMGQFKSGPNQNKFSTAKLVHSKAYYTVVAWTQDLSDMNAIERELAFADIYKAIHINVNGNDIKWNIEAQDPSYSQDIDPKTGLPTFYSLTKTFEIASAWAHSGLEPYIDHILVTYQDLVSGQLIDTTKIFKNKALDLIEGSPASF